MPTAGGTRFSRRACLVGAATALCSRTGGGATLATVRLGILQFGTIQWLADVIRRHGFDSGHAIALETLTLANTDAGRVALMAGAADIVVADWFFVATQRAAGVGLGFVPFSAATGAIMAPSASPLRSLADVKKVRLGVAGGPLDKSWLLVQAAARRTAGVDLTNVVYGAPPLLGAKLEQGELDAVLTFWNFAAGLEAVGFRQVLSVADCARALGLPGNLVLVGFVFHTGWADANRAAVEGFLAGATEAETLLARDSDEWQRLRPLMGAPDDTLFAALRRRFIEGIAEPAETPEQRQAAERLFDIVLRTGGLRATGGLARLPDGVFWQASE